MTSVPAVPAPRLLGEAARARGPRVVVITGAGISAESGLGTYRSAGAGWDDAELEQMSRADRYGNHLPRLWSWWGALRAATAAATPNVAHRALVDMQQLVEQHPGEASSFLLVTQNVDGLHQRAGSVDTVAIHGNVGVSRCMRRRCAHRWDDLGVPAAGSVPACPRCGGRVRPDVVLFGEKLDPSSLSRVRAAVAVADLCLYVGTSGNVEPVASLAVAARDAGAVCVLATLEPWESGADVFTEVLPGAATVTVPRLLDRLRRDLGAGRGAVRVTGVT